jgi:hypothetical protein
MATRFHTDAHPRETRTMIGKKDHRPEYWTHEDCFAAQQDPSFRRRVIPDHPACATASGMRA